MKKRKSLGHSKGFGVTSEIYYDILQTCRTGKNQNIVFPSANNARRHFNKMASIVCELRIPHTANSCELVLFFDNNNKLQFTAQNTNYLNYEIK